MLLRRTLRIQQVLVRHRSCLPRPVENCTLSVDALNVLRFFLPFDNTNYGHQRLPGELGVNTSPEILIATCQARVQGFLAACTSSNLSPVFVFDTGNITYEASEKWRTRREAELNHGQGRAALLGASTILREILFENRATVYQPIGVDGDDAVAKLAHMAGRDSQILSADRDMFRYALESAEKRVGADFSFSDDDLSLQLYSSHNPSMPGHVTARSLDEIPFEVQAWRNHPGNSILQTLTAVQSEHGTFRYLRGSCSPVTKQFGSLHGLSRDLRLACYARLSITHDIHESWSYWDAKSESCAWVDERVVPSSRLSHLLDSPRAALEWLQERDPSFLHGDEHPYRVFARKMIVAELIDAVHSTGMLAIVKQLGDCEATDAPCGAWPPTKWLTSTLTRACSSCGKEYILPNSERNMLAFKGWKNPRRCHSCLKQRRASRERTSTPTLPMLREFRDRISS
jgi:hypothetical protein